jgi:putative phosphotransacetylase
VDRTLIREIVQQVVNTLQEERAEVMLKPIPIGVSARHVHLSPEHVIRLFGEGYQLTPMKELSQPGQFAAQETVLIAGRRDAIENVRVLGPARGRSQVEVAFTDALRLGIVPPVRESGNIAGSAPITIVGPKGSVHLEEGLILAKRHIHMTPSDAQYYRVNNGDLVRVRTRGERSVIFDEVLIRVSEKYRLEMHIDTDEANAALLKTGDEVILISPSASQRR